MDTSVQQRQAFAEDPGAKLANTAKFPSTVPESAALTAGGIGALLAGACCVVPFVLVSVGLGGAWLANFQLFAPYRPLFVAIALAALGVTAWRVYRKGALCRPGEICPAPRLRRNYRIGFWIVAALLVVTLGFPYAAPLFD